MKKRYRRILVLIIATIFILAIIILAKKIINNSSSQDTIKVVESIEEYGYTLDDRDTDVMKKEFSELKKVLKEKDIDYKKYAEEIAKLFVMDLFTLNNKLNKYDVGSFEYVYPDNVNNYKMNVEDTIYKHMENSNKGKRNQALSIVKEVKIDEVKETTYKIGDKEYEGYSIKLNWTYETDLGYDKKATITLVKLDNKLYVVEYVAGE